VLPLCRVSDDARSWTWRGDNRVVISSRDTVVWSLQTSVTDGVYCPQRHRNGRSFRCLDSARPARFVPRPARIAARTRTSTTVTASALYRQALLTLRDPALAEHVVCNVIVDECALSPPPGRGEADARHRLAESAFRRCQRLAAGHDRGPGRPPGAGVADCIDPGGLLSGTERGALGLVLFGGLGYVRASKVVGIRPRDMAALLQAVLRRLTSSSAANPGPLPPAQWDIMSRAALADRVKGRR
jgi:hypothetical protein